MAQPLRQTAQHLSEEERGPKWCVWERGSSESVSTGLPRFNVICHTSHQGIRDVSSLLSSQVKIFADIFVFEERFP